MNEKMKKFLINPYTASLAYAGVKLLLKFGHSAMQKRVADAYVDAYNRSRGLCDLPASTSDNGKEIINASRNVTEPAVRIVANLERIMGSNSSKPENSEALQHYGQTVMHGISLKRGGLERLSQDFSEAIRFIEPYALPTANAFAFCAFRDITGKSTNCLITRMWGLLSSVFTLAIPAISAGVDIIKDPSIDDVPKLIMAGFCAYLGYETGKRLGRMYEEKSTNVGTDLSDTYRLIIKPLGEGIGKGVGAVGSGIGKGISKLFKKSGTGTP